MDKNVRNAQELKVSRLVRELEKNNMKGVVLETGADVITYLNENIEDNKKVALGGSMTVIDMGIPQYLRNRNVTFYDRYQPGITKEEMKEVFRQSFFCDYYISSTNAVTMDGTLVNVDGTGNRTAALIYGPDKVFVVVGVNKIVTDKELAYDRVREFAAPMNNMRLNTGNPCTLTGSCMDCRNASRICNIYTEIKRQSVKDRIEVLIVMEDLGY